MHFHSNPSGRHHVDQGQYRKEKLFHYNKFTYKTYKSKTFCNLQSKCIPIHNEGKETRILQLKSITQLKSVNKPPLNPESDHESLCRI
jgi:hypothetical protein